MNDVTSIGIVADPRYHGLSEMNRFERALDWLQREQPVLAAQIRIRQDKLMDFSAVKNIAFGCKQIFSADRWALTGEAGVFLDPLYSPGTDLIAMNNSLIVALIQRDLRSRPINGQAQVFENLFANLVENTGIVYRNQYGLFGNPVVMTVKLAWDYAVYWSVTAFLYMQGRLTQIGILGEVRLQTERMSFLNKQMQEFFRRWSEMDVPDLKAKFIDQSGIALLRRLNRELDEKLDDDAFRERLSFNMATLNQLAHEINTRATARHPELPVFEQEDECGDRGHFNYLWTCLEYDQSPSVL